MTRDQAKQQAKEMRSIFGDATTLAFLEKQGFIDAEDISDPNEYNLRAERADALASGYVRIDGKQVELPFDMQVIAQYWSSSDDAYFDNLHRLAARKILNSI